MFCASACINARAAAVFSLLEDSGSIRIFASVLTITPRIASGIGHLSLNAFSQRRVSRIILLRQNRFLPSQFLPSSDDDIAVLRTDLHSETPSTELLCCD